MDADEKNAISHRALAVNKLALFLSKGKIIKIKFTKEKIDSILKNRFKQI
jgi:hypothetical protein